MIGDENSGKTSIALRYTNDKFDEESNSPTIGVDFLVKNEKKTQTPMRINIWDTAGACRFHSIVRSFFRSAIGAIVVYDITNRSSFNGVTKWIKEVRELSGHQTNLILLGNKCDSDDRQVSTEEGKNKAFQENIPFYEVSAKTGKNIKTAFDYFNTINHRVAKIDPDIKAILLENDKANNICFC